MSASQPPSAASTSALSSGVASRFVSADALEQAKQKRAEEWKEAYARLGQEPPPEMTGNGDGEVYDPRSLFERLQENKTKKQEAFEEQLKFKNHFRALDEEEISFLDSIVDENNDEEQERKKAIQDELRAYREAVTKRSAAAPPPSLASHTLSPPIPAVSPPLASSSTASTSSSTTSAPIKKPGAGGKKRKLLPGVVVPPKKPKTAAAGKSTSPTTTMTTTVVAKDTAAVSAPAKEGEKEAGDYKKDGAAGKKDETEASTKADSAVSDPNPTGSASTS